MISLSAEPALQVQIGQAISIMAEADFPDQWEGLIDVSLLDFRHRGPFQLPADTFSFRRSQQLVTPLTPTDFVVNNAVLQTAHSIFRR